MRQSKAFITAALALVGVILVGGVALYARNKNTTSQVSDTTTTTNTGTTGTAGTPTGNDGAVASKYKDGTYTATGMYVSPGGKQSITFTVTLAGGTVTALTAKNGAIDRESSQYQNRFIGGLNAIVVGKNIDSLNVTEVSGSSLTSGGFNDAISKIKTQAQA